MAVRCVTLVISLLATPSSPPLPPPPSLPPSSLSITSLHLTQSLVVSIIEKTRFRELKKKRYRRTDRRTNGRTDRQTLLQRCEDAYEKTRIVMTDAGSIKSEEKRITGITRGICKARIGGENILKNKDMHQLRK